MKVGARTELSRRVGCYCCTSIGWHLIVLPCVVIGTRRECRSGSRGCWQLVLVQGNGSKKAAVGNTWGHIHDRSRHLKDRDNVIIIIPIRVSSSGAAEEIASCRVQLLSNMYSYFTKIQSWGFLFSLERFFLHGCGRNEEVGRFDSIRVVVVVAPIFSRCKTSS